VSEKTVLIAKKDMIATITLNRPESNNAFDYPMMEAIDSAINDVAADKGIRVVIITGAGKAFCSGHAGRGQVGVRQNGYRRYS
jgi:2-(1,2-epoxy-1,2-dihydrophenyl)acetyl-CoA isomerase